MNSPAPISVDEAPETSSRMRFPSWLISLLLHGGLMTFIALGYGQIDGGLPGTAEEGFREVGIVVKDNATPSENLNEETEHNEEQPTLKEPTKSYQPQEQTNLPPVQLPTPQPNPGMVGPGMPAPPVPSFAESSPSPKVTPSGPLSTGSPAMKGDNSTEFFGIRDKGESFLYVLDCSGSMDTSGGPNQPSAIQVAKGELLASLRNLNPEQKFQVIFYNNKVHPLAIHGKGGEQPELFWATSINLTLATQQIQRLSPEGGTSHLPALLLALSLKPDVIYFLTDIDTKIQPADLNLLQRKNKLETGGKTRIHCIEFGKFGEPVVDNFLKQVAREHNGTYRYRDISKFTTSRP